MQWLLCWARVADFSVFIIAQKKINPQEMNELCENSLKLYIKNLEKEKSRMTYKKEPIQ